ncbi:nitroreductase family protein [Alteromonas sp. SM 2104]|nr:nitroreductase family protein [Alteromonas oceanisediminis]
MRPRRSVFAEGYIGETVSCFRDCVMAKRLDHEEQKWAHDVLCLYFDVVSATPIVDTQRKAFSAISSSGAQVSSVPYAHDTLPKCPLDYDELLTLFKRRRSVRWYQQKPVEWGKLQQAINAASLAPSACNRQPFKFYAFNHQDKAVDIAACAMGTAGWVNNLPCSVVVVGDLSAYPKERDRHVIYIDGALAAMQFMLACETLSLSTCPINWPDIESREQMMSKKLNLSPYERPIMLISVGYAIKDGGIPFSQKKNADTLLKQH